MKEDFEITIPEIEYLVTKIDDLIGSTGGVRMTGGGFGGCVIALAPKEAIPLIQKDVIPSYFDKFGLHAELHVCSAESGTSVVEL